MADEFADEVGGAFYDDCDFLCVISLVMIVYTYEYKGAGMLLVRFSEIGGAFTFTIAEDT